MIRTIYNASLNYHDRKQEIRDGLSRARRGMVLMIGPGIIFCGWWYLGAPTPDLGFNGWERLLFSAIFFAGYYFWVPFFYASIVNSKLMIFGRKPAEALGEAEFGTIEEMRERGHIGGPQQTFVYLGRPHV